MLLLMKKITIILFLLEVKMSKILLMLTMVSTQRSVFILTLHFLIGSCPPTEHQIENHYKGMVCKGPSVVNPISTEENESYVKMCSIPNRLSPNGWSCGMNYEQGIDQIVYTNAMSYVRTGLSFRIGKVN